MKRPALLRSVAIALALLAVGATAADPSDRKGETYRWVDDKGITHYSDQVPPEAAKQRRTRLSPQGQELGVIEAAKTREQLRQEQELKQLRSRQEKILAEQRDRDLALLRTYRGSKEIFSALQAKLDTLDGIAKITEMNRQRQKYQLSTQEQRAAELERQGQAVSQNLRDLIQAARRQIANYDLKLREIEIEKAQLTERYTKDAARFEALEAQLKNAGQQPASGTATTGAGATGDETSAIACGAVSTCDRAWALAREYVLKSSPLPLSVDTERVIQTMAPANDNEFGITVTRIADKSEYIIFLDVRCRPSSIGEALCAGAKARDVRVNFKAYIEAGLGSIATDSALLPP
jgi:hypothetical protein